MITRVGPAWRLKRRAWCNGSDEMSLHNGTAAETERKKMLEAEGHIILNQCAEFPLSFRSHTALVSFAIPTPARVFRPAEDGPMLASALKTYAPKGTLITTSKAIIIPQIPLSFFIEFSGNKREKHPFCLVKHQELIPEASIPPFCWRHAGTRKSWSCGT